jgi:hypothetical protein
MMQEDRMGLFILKSNGGDPSSGQLVEATSTNLNLESHLEAWLERSPGAMTGVPTLWIGRQTSACVEDTTIFPDLLGLDDSGNLLILELKKGKAPREVVAQLLEYAAWAHGLSDEAIRNIANGYCASSDGLKGKSLEEIYKDVFDAEELPNLNKKQKFFVVAEDIPPGVARVCRFLRSNHGLDISCISVSAHKTKSDEILISTNFVVGQEDVISVADTTSKGDRWSDPKSVKEVVRDVVDEMTKGDSSLIFTPKDVSDRIHKAYPNFNPATVRCQLTSDCVNHTSRKHYPGGEDRLWLVDRGKFRLFNSAKDHMSEP